MTAHVKHPPNAGLSSKLQTLRSQLAGLRRARRMVRWTTAWSALATGVLWILAALFLLDFVFEMSVVQRVIVLLLSAAGVAALFIWLVRPLLGRGETEIEMALLVERQQEIDSDLVAALQFESPQARQWGSWQLTDAVVDYVGQLGRGLDVFAGFSRAVMLRRGAVLLATVTAVGGLVLWRPDYAAVFVHRLLLGAQHYPTATRIEKILVNSALVLDGGSSPAMCRAAEGRPLEFIVLCSGRLPAEGELREIHITSAGAGRSDAARVELRPLGGQQRLERLEQVGNQLQLALDGQVDFLSPAWIEETAALAQADAPQTAAAIAAFRPEAADLQRTLAGLQKTIRQFDTHRQTTGLYRGTLAQMVDSLDYTVRLNDAWTDPARVALIAQPAVEMQLTPTPPPYARAGDVIAESGARQISVLQGSDVEVAIRAVVAKGQTKELREAWLTVLGDAPRRFELESPAAGQPWRLPPDASPLANIQSEVRFEIDVTDADGLHLDRPLAGYIRLKADRPPTGTAALVSHVVLPTARPVITWQGVTDDYGVAAVRLHVDVYRQGQQPPEAAATESPGNEIPAETVSSDAPLGEGEPTSTTPVGNVEAEGPPKKRCTFELLAQTATAAQLPLSGEFALDLAPLELEKGDSLNVMLEVVDFRGDDPGAAFRGDPLPIEVSDESGVKMAVLEPDERAEQQIDEIKNELLEAGDSP